MLAAVAAAPGSLPLLQFAAARLWTERDQGRRLLTRASYQAMGGIAGTLAGHADNVLGAISGRERVLVRTLFERLADRLHQLLELGPVDLLRDLDEPVIGRDFDGRPLRTRGQLRLPIAWPA